MCQFGHRSIAASLLAIFLVDFITASLEPTLSIHLFEFYEMGIWDVSHGELGVGVGLGHLGCKLFRL